MFNRALKTGKESIKAKQRVSSNLLDLLRVFAVIVFIISVAAYYLSPPAFTSYFSYSYETENYTVNFTSESGSE